MSKTERLHMDDLGSSSASEQIKATRSARMEEFKAIIRNIPFTMRSLLVQSGSVYLNILHQQIAYIYSQDSQSILVTKKGEKYPLDLSLDVMMAKLDTTHFSRMSKFLIASLEALKGMHMEKDSTLYVDLIPDLGFQFVYDQQYHHRT